MTTIPPSIGPINPIGPQPIGGPTAPIGPQPIGGPTAPILDPDTYMGIHPKANLHQLLTACPDTTLAQASKYFKGLDANMTINDFHKKFPEVKAQQALCLFWDKKADLATDFKLQYNINETYNLTPKQTTQLENKAKELMLRQFDPETYMLLFPKTTLHQLLNAYPDTTLTEAAKIFPKLKDITLEEFHKKFPGVTAEQALKLFWDNKADLGTNYKIAYNIEQTYSLTPGQKTSLENEAKMLAQAQTGK